MGAPFTSIIPFFISTRRTPIFCLIYLGVVIFCIVADQLTKIWIYDGLLNGGKGPSVQIIGKFLQFSPVLNRGAAFGMGNSQASDIVFFVVTVVGIPVFCYLLLRSRTRSLLSQISFAMIIGGTIGNAIDRATYATEGTFFSGGVRDFISFSIFFLELIIIPTTIATIASTAIRPGANPSPTVPTVTSVPIW